MFDTNPNHIQGGEGAGARGDATPLVLIHDGGGTVFSYYLLGDLGRRVFGIANPRFKTGTPWCGGLHEMAVLYADYVVRAVPSGPVILGGWSLGGLLAVETADVLSRAYPAVRVAGLVLIDSVCPLPPAGGWAAVEAHLVERRIEWPATTAAVTKMRVERCFREAHRMVREWALPAARPPPTVLLRSTDAVPVPLGSGDGSLVFVDMHRGDRRLGWGSYRTDMVRQTLDIPGHHYSVFALDQLETVTRAIQTACQQIEKGL